MIKPTLLKVLILLLSINEVYATVPLNKFKSEEFLTEFIETPTRYIFIDLDKCDEGLSCDNVTYYEINKKTGKALRIKGHTVNIGPTDDFKGYAFTIREKTKQLFYIVRLIGGVELTVTDNKKTYYDEKLRQYD